ncbi:MAG TPA: LysM peptidoglycan-binding domain-containing protein [Acidimicrobiales bacterium]|nr:LysM peptidoglycan-binding domain-containing protein [Acidimicrobiales bacterium]
MAAAAERRYEPEAERARRARGAGAGRMASLQPVGEGATAADAGPNGDAAGGERGWNVLAEELLAYPPRAKRLWLEPRGSVSGAGGASEDDAPRAYADAWLERELAALHARRAGALRAEPARSGRADVDLLGAPPRQPGEGSSVRGGSQRSLGHREARLAEPVRHLAEEPSLRSLRRVATARKPAVARARSRGLRRLLPGAATLAVLAASWFAVGALAASANAVHVVMLPGSTAVRGGFVYTARPGDTLWSIALRAEPGADPRPLVDRLEAELGGGTLQPGDRLFIPA